MRRGERVEIRSQEFTVSTSRSCPTDRDRYRVRARPQFPVPPAAIRALAERFPGFRFSDELGAARFPLGPLRVLVLADGEIVIRRAATQQEALAAVRAVVAALRAPGSG